MAVSPGIDTAFPNTRLVENIRIMNPDLLFFSGIRSTRVEDMAFIGLPLNWLRLIVTKDLSSVGRGDLM